MRRPFDFAGRSAYLYTRVSTSEQAEHGYSVGDQTALLTAWAARAGVTIAATFTDDESAKTGAVVGDSFRRRSGWQALLAASVLHPAGRGGPDLVLVKDWSRFGRDTASALVVLQELGALGIEVQAVTSLVDHSTPTALFQVLIPLATAEVENRQRSVNVKRGIRAALRQGHWLARPPAGYTRERTAGRGVAVMQIDPDMGPVVAAAFALAADPGIPVAEVYRRAKAAGLTVSRARFFRMLADTVYAARITIAAWPEAGEAADEVAALHEPLVDARTFARVQLRLSGGGLRADGSPSARRPGERGPSPAFPLRGVLLCGRCGLPMTTDLSRGRTGAVYAYYLCHRHAAERTPDWSPATLRVPAQTVHAGYGALLSRYHVSAEVRALALALVTEREEASRDDLRRRRAALRAALVEQETRRDRIEDRYVDGDLTRDVYDRTAARCAAEVERIRDELDRIGETDVVAEAERVRVSVRLACDLGGVWTRAEASGDTEAMSALAGSIHPSGTVFAGGTFRTTTESPLIALLTGKRGETRDGQARYAPDRLPEYAEGDGFGNGTGPESIVAALSQDVTTLRLAAAAPLLLRYAFA